MFPLFSSPTTTFKAQSFESPLIVAQQQDISPFQAQLQIRYEPANLILSHQNPLLKSIQTSYVPISSNFYPFYMQSPPSFINSVCNSLPAKINTNIPNNQFLSENTVTLPQQLSQPNHNDPQQIENTSIQTALYEKNNSNTNKFEIFCPQKSLLNSPTRKQHKLNEQIQDTKISKERVEEIKPKEQPFNYQRSQSLSLSNFQQKRRQQYEIKHANSKRQKANSIQFVEENDFTQGNLFFTQSSSLLQCNYRERQHGDPCISLSSSAGTFSGPSEQQSAAIEKQNTSIQDELDEQEDEEDSEFDFVKEGNKSNILLSSLKKKLLLKLSSPQKEIIKAMKQAKKFNFSKNVIKQFLKVILKTDYIYEQISNQSKKYRLKKNPPLEQIIQFRQNLQQYVAQSSFKHSGIKRIIDFLISHSQEWLITGKSKYKEEQRIMLSYLQLCVKNPKLLIFLSQHEHNSKQQ